MLSSLCSPALNDVMVSSYLAISVLHMCVCVCEFNDSPYWGLTVSPHHLVVPLVSGLPSSVPPSVLCPSRSISTHTHPVGHPTTMYPYLQELSFVILKLLVPV